MNARKKNFKEQLQRLTEITQLLENEDVEIEDSIKLYEEGINLSKELYQKLNEAELKITEIKKGFESNIRADKKDL